MGVGLCKDQILLADPCLAKVPQEVCIDVDWVWLGCFAANSAVASSIFFVPLFICGPLRTLRFFISAYNSDKLLGGSLSR